jgi:drug/metabolite transporter (DMT)-like permease
MNTSETATAMKNKKVILSTLWIFATLNYIYADIFNLFFNPQAQSGTTPPGPIFVFAILMETSIAAVLLSRVLKYGINRWANIISGAINTALVGWTLFGETPPSYYLFFAAIEIATTLFIVWYAWRWREQESQPSRDNPKAKTT